MPEEEEAFVPEEDIQGTFTQGDGLMAAKAKRQRDLAAARAAAGM